MKSETALRWLVRAGVVAAIATLSVWIANNTYWDEITVPMPLKGEAAANPYYATQKFLEALDAKVESRQSLSSLPPTDAAIILKDWHWDLIEARREKLETWVRAGGRLIVDKTLIGIFSGFTEFAGIELRVPRPPKKAKKADNDAQAEDDSSSDDSDDVETIDGEKEEDEEECVRWNVAIDALDTSGSRDAYSLCNVTTTGWLVSKQKPVWAVRDERGLQSVRVQIGAGTVTVVNASPFGNRDFRDVDRGAFLVAVTQLHGGDEVWLLTEMDHPSLLTLIWRYGAPVVLLFALFVAAICWRSAVRFGPLRATTDPARRSLAEQIRGTGWFIHRLGGSRTLYSAMLRALNETAERRIAGYERLSQAQRVAAVAAHTGVDGEALQEALFAANDSKHRLYRAITTLESARRALLQGLSTD